jgi:hypothetical protein
MYPSAKRDLYVSADTVLTCTLLLTSAHLAGNSARCVYYVGGAGELTNLLFESRRTLNPNVEFMSRIICGSRILAATRMRGKVMT